MTLPPPLLSDDDTPFADGDPALGTITKTRKKKPRLYKVILHNDDYTPMEFVIYILMRHFHMSTEKAYALTMAIHTQGLGICGLFTYDIAETKCSIVLNEAKQQAHPLRCTIEAESPPEDDEE
ncbi:MAG: ATP-dependent Clp protease adaptor ClpS [Alphaproteobacteria bacterium]|nr:ATP-dependent Clp protease adaptor ClpS [Alphaproteobacteria bacterium]